MVSLPLVLFTPDQEPEAEHEEASEELQEISTLPPIGDELKLATKEIIWANGFGITAEPPPPPPPHDEIKNTELIIKMLLFLSFIRTPKIN